MTLDKWLLYIHIISAGTWLGSGVMLSILSVRARQTGNEKGLIDQMEWAGARIGGPAVIATLATGVWMVARSSAWTFSQLWVLGGLIFLGGLFLVGVGFHVPQYKRIRRASEEFGEGSEVVQRLVNQSFRAARLEVILIAIAILLMVFKPGI